jgi:hypothetical protein
VIIRDLSLHDLVSLEKEAQFPLPNLSSSLYCIKKSIEYEDKFIGSFWVKMTSETSLILSPNISNLTRAIAIKEIFNFLFTELTKAGLDDSHLFIQNNDQFVDFLKKHFGFKDNLGTPLYISSRGVQNGQGPDKLRY